jgi:uncharacterized tellurite resistance protein B-like protein
MSFWQRFRDAFLDEAPGLKDYDHDTRVAIGALLLEMCRADFEVRAEEMRALIGSIQSSFGLSAADTDTLLAQSEAEADVAVSLRLYTSVINDRLDSAQKRRVLAQLWAIALADGDIHQQEELLLVRVGELLKIPERTVKQIREGAE